jgi:hypothetical protein
MTRTECAGCVYVYETAAAHFVWGAVAGRVHTGERIHADLGAHPLEVCAELRVLLDVVDMLPAHEADPNH